MQTKVAILSRNFSRIAGGAESYAVHLATAMRAECDITVVSQVFEESATLFKHVRVPALPIRTRWLNALWFNWHSARLTRSGFDIVHSFENVTHSQVHTVSVKTVHASLKQRGMSALRIALSPRLLAYLWLEKKRLCTAGHVSVFVSEFLLQETLALLPCIASSSVMPPCVNIPTQPFKVEEKIAARIQLGLQPHTMTIGFVGHDFKKKGLDTLLKGAALLPFDLQIMVIGRADQASQYAQLVQAMGPGKTCRFMGAVRDMPQAYAAMHCLAHPTTQDAFPTVLLEAMAHHVPVITTDEPYNNMGSLLTQHSNAILIQTPDHIDAMATGLKRLWLEPALHTTIASKGFEFAKQYSWDAAKAVYYAAYRRANSQIIL